MKTNYSFAFFVVLACLLLFTAGCAQNNGTGQVTAAFAGTETTVTFGERNTDTFNGKWEDTWVYSFVPNANYGDGQSYDYMLSWYNHADYTRYSHVRVDITGLPDDADITAASLNFYIYKGEADPYTVSVSSLSGAGADGWTETGDTWNTYNGTNGWTGNEGGNQNRGAELGSAEWNAESQWAQLEFNAAGLEYLETKRASGKASFIVGVSPDEGTTGDFRNDVASSEFSAQQIRPYLSVTYASEEGESCTDNDSDGYGTAGSSGCTYSGTDCDDSSSAVNPGATETCNSVDDDCDGDTDEGGVCDDCEEGTTQPCGETEEGACSYGTQTCVDGEWGECGGDYQGPESETCGNGIDEDCDGQDLECGECNYDTFYVCGNAAECNTGISGWNTGNDSAGCCNSKSSPCKTIGAAVAKMTADDTLIIGNGIYTGENPTDNSNQMYYWGARGLPSGEKGEGDTWRDRSFTTVKAEVPFGVILDGSYTYPDTNGYAVMLFMENKSYLHFDGLILFRTWANFHKVDHIKITRCGFIEAAPFFEGCDYEPNNSCGVAYNLGFSNASNVLVEYCFAIGEGRYKFGVSKGTGPDTSRNIIFRHNVSRYDYYYDDPVRDSGVFGEISNFANYQQREVIFQNDIAIDGLDFRSVDTSRPAGFMFPNGCESSTVEGCIVLNSYSTGAILAEGTVNERLDVINTVLWDMHESDRPNNGQIGGIRVNDDYGKSNFRFVTSGNSDTSRAWEHKANYPGGPSNIYNSILYNFYALLDLPDSKKCANQSFDVDHSLFYNNVCDGRTGTNPIFMNPIDGNGLTYLPMIDVGSPLYTAGADGQPVGATILKKIGVEGTFYGDEGWDEVTDEDLWPWEYENEFMEYMCDNSYNEHEGETDLSGNPVDFQRGFCEPGNGLYGGPRTLTSYIWEYLGNPMPEWVYGDSPPPPPECGEGEIFSECSCGAGTYEDGYCCSGEWQNSECGESCEPECVVDDDCPLFTCCKHAGECNAQCKISMGGLTYYITQWQIGEMSLTQIIEKVAEWSGSGAACLN
ncbi:MAG: DNRLRE domain-containing protein [Candidatus Diapherotrites archaeon]|nr:DNRLRE domain-containing protein [Candidatus Micrarchaeota archaeon]MBU1939444.1 DNRLRE domain-containing protein [Candidatus Micrarchaeota archaeon]